MHVMLAVLDSFSPKLTAAAVRAPTLLIGAVALLPVSDAAMAVGPQMDLTMSAAAADLPSCLWLGLSVQHNARLLLPGGLCLGKLPRNLCK